MAAARRHAATTRKRTAAPRGAATRRKRLVEASARGAAAARRALASSVAAPLFVLVLVGVAAVAVVAAVACVSADRTGANEASTTSAALGTREANLQAQSLALRAADCATYGTIATQHAGALGLTPERRLEALAALAVSVPVGAGGVGGALDPGFAHLRLALDHDLAAAAWSAAGEPGRAAAATRLAAGEALQAEAYAAAVCG